ncbi:MAG TPA: universal stress protein, partial [Hanamia sp.]|nr:universal stress protein [Hanamia sp.]
MKRILVPIDFSPTSKKAFRYAVDIAFKSSGTIILCHFFRTLKSSKARATDNAREYNQQLEANSLKRLQRFKKKVLTDTKKEVTVSTLIGRMPVVKNILKLAESNHIDLIVMGTQGATGLKKITVGSIAAKVMEKSEIAVLLVPEKFVWNKPEKILFTTTICKSDNKVFPVLLTLARLYGAQITVINLHDPHQPDGFKEKKEFEMYAYSVQRTFDHVNIQFRQLDTFSVEKTMENLHEEIPYDLLVMARRKLDFFTRFLQKSFTKKMAYVTTLPLLIVPEK